MCSKVLLLSFCIILIFIKNIIGGNKFKFCYVYLNIYVYYVVNCIGLYNCE